MPEDSLILRGIKVSQENRDVTFALSGQGERVFLKTDVSSMNNYVIQKNIEGYVFFDPTWANMPKVDPATLSTWGLKDAALWLFLENVPDPEAANLIFRHKPELTPEEIVEKALAYKPIILPPPDDVSK